MQGGGFEPCQSQSTHTHTPWLLLHLMTLVTACLLCNHACFHAGSCPLPAGATARRPSGRSWLSTLGHMPTSRQPRATAWGLKCGRLICRYSQDPDSACGFVHSVTVLAAAVLAVAAEIAAGASCVGGAWVGASCCAELTEFKSNCQYEREHAVCCKVPCFC